MVCSPKLLIHIFVGSRLAYIAENGDSMSTTDKAINYIGMALGGILGLVIGVVIYNRTMIRADELAAEEAAGLGSPRGGGGTDYADTEAGLMDPEAAAALMDDDDISLWDNDEFGHDFDDGYRDDEAGVEMGVKLAPSTGSTELQNGNVKDDV